MNDNIRDYEFVVEYGNKLHVYIKNNFLVHKKATKIQRNEYPQCAMRMKLKYV